MDLEEWAQEAGAILVVPSSCCSIAEWMFFSPATDNEDLIFFDDTLNCLWQQYAYDHKRIYTTGMSAGGLFSTFLTLHRSEWLAASVLFSGGTEGFFSYRTPADPIPALVAWGGPTDTWGSYDFDVSSQAFSEDLREDGHFVAECMHGSGHTLSPSWLDWAWTWMADHPKGVDPEPYEDGLPGEFPNWCDIPE